MFAIDEVAAGARFRGMRVTGFDVDHAMQDVITHNQQRWLNEALHVLQYRMKPT